jgi:hypothetical protein
MTKNEAAPLSDFFWENKPLKKGLTTNQSKG